MKLVRVRLRIEINVAEQQDLEKTKHNGQNPLTLCPVFHCHRVFQGSLRWCSTIVFSIQSLSRFSKAFVTGGSAAPAWSADPPCRWRRKSHPHSIDMPHCPVSLQSFSSSLRVCASVCPKCRGRDLTQVAALSWISPSNGRAGGTTTGC